MQKINGWTYDWHFFGQSTWLLGDWAIIGRSESLNMLPSLNLDRPLETSGRVPFNGFKFSWSTPQILSSGLFKVGGTLPIHR